MSTYHMQAILNDIFFIVGICLLVGFGALIIKFLENDKTKPKQDKTDITEIKSVKDDFSAMPCPYCGAPLNGRVNFVVTCSSCGMKTKLK